MERIFLEEIVKSCNGKVISGNIDKYIESVYTDSRQKGKNGLFICIKGEKTDGHKYINDAVNNGAIAVLVTDENINFLDNITYILVEDIDKALKSLALYYRLKFNIPIVAVTGSVGKTTTKDMIASVLSRKFNTLKTKGNLNSDIGVPLTLLNINKSHEIAVIEMGMDHLGQIDSISKAVLPSTAVITNIGDAHIEFLKTRENILKAKCEIFNNLLPNSTAVLNCDDDMLSTINNDVKKVWVGTKENADIKAYNICIDYDKANITFNFLVNGNEYLVEVPGISKHLVYPALSAIAVGIIYNVDINEIIEGIKNYTSSGMRMDTYKLKNDSLLIDDTYNASPASMKSLIDTISKSSKKNKIVILGDMLELGDETVKLHKEVINYALESNLTHCVFSGENMQKAIELVEDKSKLVYFKTKEELLNHLNDYISENSIIGVKASRGMKFEDITQKILETF